MAMLAEPRRRKRYNLVPRGKALYEDESRFGTKMLEKMGWSKGKGLGAKEDGSKDFVRVRYKNDAEGLGYEARDDQWTAHEESFNGLLKSLIGGEKSGNTETNAAVNSEGEGSDGEFRSVGFGFREEVVEKPKNEKKKLKENISGISLEEKSKASKARVHYKKFTRGKDLAQYSEKDLANIFGKKSSEEQAEDIYQQLHTAISAPEKEVKENLAGVQTIGTGISVSDYFKQKMEALKKKKKNDQSPLEQTQLIEDLSDITVSKKKKKGKDRDRDEVQVDTNLSLEVNALHQKDSEKQATLVNDKKKKRKHEEEGLCDTAEIVDTSETVKKKKPKRDKRGEEDDFRNTEVFISNETEKQEIRDTDPKKHKKKNKYPEKLDSKDVKNKITEEKQEQQEEKLQYTSMDDKQSNEIINLTSCKDSKEVKEGGFLNELQSKQEIAPKKKKHKKREDSGPENLSQENDSSRFVFEPEKKKKKYKDAIRDKQIETAILDVSPTNENISNRLSADNSSDEDSDSSKPTQSTEGLLSLEQLICKRDSYDVFTISSFCAEQFHNIDLDAYQGANIAQITGYGITDNIKLNVIKLKTDEERILNLWTLKDSKYGNKKTKQGVYRRHVKSVRKQQIKSVSRSNLKAFKRRNAFSGL